MYLSEAQLRVLVAPRTREVFGALRNTGPMSVDELQTHLGTDSKAVYHHLAKLKREGLVKTAGQTQGKRRAKVVYQALTESLNLPDGFVSAEYERLAAKGVAANLRSVTRRFQKTAELAPDNPKLVDSLFSLTSSFSISDEDFKEFKRRLMELQQEFKGRSPEGAPKTHSFVAVVTPHESRLQ